MKSFYGWCVRGGSDANPFPQLALDLSIRKAGANCWVEGTDETSGFVEEKTDARKKRGLSVMLWRKKALGRART